MRLQRFNDSAPVGALHQTAAWPVINPATKGQSYLYFVVSDSDGTWCSAGLVRLSKLLGGFSLAAIQRGPVTRQIEELPQVLAVLETGLRKKGAVNLTVNPFWIGAQAEVAQKELENIGYTVLGPELRNMPTATAMTDLSRDEEEIQHSFTPANRRAIAKSIREGLIIRDVETLDEARALNDCMRGMAAATGMILDSQHDFTTHLTHLRDNPDQGCILIALLDDILVAGAVIYREGSRSTCFLLTSPPDLETKIPRTNLITWESLRRMKAMGCTEFDFVGYPDDRLGREDDLSRGRFKASFTPEIKYVTPLMVKPFRKVPSAIAQAMRGIVRKSKIGKSVKRVLRRT